MNKFIFSFIFSFLFSLYFIPTIKAVVVAIAGMILPAINLLLKKNLFELINSKIK